MSSLPLPAHLECRRGQLRSDECTSCLLCQAWKISEDPFYFSRTRLNGTVSCIYLHDRCGGWNCSHVQYLGDDESHLRYARIDSPASNADRLKGTFQLVALSFVFSFTISSYRSKFGEEKLKAQSSCSWAKEMHM